MNFSLQKKVALNQKKADSYDQMVKKCRDLEQQNMKLLELASKD